MTATECPRPLQTIFPSSTTKTQIPGRRPPGYKKIRWRKYDPSKKSPNPATDLFVQWEPPAPSRDAEEDDHVEQRKPKRQDEGKQVSQSKALACLSPVEPLP